MATGSKTTTGNVDKKTNKKNTKEDFVGKT